MARVEEGERLWSKIEMREMRFKERKSTIHHLREEIAKLKFEKKEMQAEFERLRKCSATIELTLSETGDKIDMPWLLSQLREKFVLKERNAELEEIIVGKGYTIKAAEAEKDYREKESELDSEIGKFISLMEILKGQAKEVGSIEVTELLMKLEVVLLVLGSEEEKDNRVSKIVYDNANLQERVAELEEIIRGEGYTTNAAAAERDLRMKEEELASEIKRITEVMAVLNEVVEGVNRTDIDVLLRQLEEVLGIFGSNSEDSLDITPSVIASSGWNFDCMTFLPNDYAALAIGRSSSTLETVETSSSTSSGGVESLLMP